MTAATTPRVRCSHFLERREHVVAIAAGLFRQKGYAATSVQDLANAVGVHKSTIFHYFDSKDDLLFSIVSDVCAAVDGIARRAPAPDAPPLERVTDYLRRFIDLGLTQPAKFAVYRDDVEQLSPDRLDTVWRHREGQRHHVRSLLADAQRRHALQARADPDLLAEMLIDAARGLSAAGSHRRHTTSPEVLTGFLLTGLVGTSARRLGASEP